MEGELRKLKQNTKIGIGAWGTRFFSLDPEFFSYYKNNKKGEPLGYFPVAQMVCVGPSPLQEDTCFYFRLPASFGTTDGHYKKQGNAEPLPSDKDKEKEGDKTEDKTEKPAGDAKHKDPVILLRCNTTAERDEWIQAFVDLGVKKVVAKDKPVPKPEEKTEHVEKTEKAKEDADKAPETTEKPTASSPPDSSSSSSSSTPVLLPVQADD